MNNASPYSTNEPGNLSVSNHHSVDLRTLKKSLPLRVLDAEQFAMWQEQGYVIIKNAISTQAVTSTRQLLWEFQEMDPDNPATWNKAQQRDHAMTELNNSGMVECYHHQELWNNRQSQRVYDAFVDIWDREDLWVTIDRANLNPPNRNSRSFNGFIHWDANTSLTPLPTQVQGVLALSDTDEETGGFQCVPQLYRDLEVWRQNQPEDRDPFNPDLTGYDIEFVPMNAGDLLIFNGLLPHGIRPNRSDRVRLAQYISMAPAEEDNPPLKEWRVQSWHDRIPPQGFAFPGDPRGWEQTKYPRAELSLLGRKLLGKDLWTE